MASGKAMANPGRSRGDAQAEVEAKLREMSAKIAHLNERTEKALAALRWYPYAAGLVLFGLGAAVSAILF